MEVFEKLKNILSREFGVNPQNIHLKTSIEDLGFSSIEYMGVIAVIEEEFKICIPDKKIPQIVCVEDMIKAIRYSTEENSVENNMTDRDVIDGVKKIISQQFNIGISNIKGYSNLKSDLGINSLDLADIIFQLEDKFNIYLEDEEICDCETVEDLAEVIQNSINVTNDINQIF